VLSVRTLDRKEALLCVWRYSARCCLLFG